jgi:hypothetical protein
LLDSLSSVENGLIAAVYHRTQPTDRQFVRSSDEDSIYSNQNQFVTPYTTAIATNWNSCFDDTQSLWYAQQQQPKDINIFDTTTITGLGVPGVDTANQRVVDISTTKILAVLVESVELRNDCESLNFIPPEYNSSSEHIVSNYVDNDITKQIGLDVPHVEDAASYFTLGGDWSCLGTMLTTPTRRGPTAENGDTIQYDVTQNRSHGRVPVRAQTSASNEMQRNSGMNGVVEDGPNSTTTRNDAALQQPTPLFERLVTEEVQELRAYVRIVENQNRRLVELERVHGDLEARLELESKSRQQVEATLEAREREWAEKLDHVERDRDHWKDLVEAEKIKNSKLIDQVYRKDQDIHRMLQRKVCVTVMTINVYSNINFVNICSQVNNFPLLSFSLFSMITK